MGELRRSQQQAKEDEAAVRIQSAWRGKQARKNSPAVKRHQKSPGQHHHHHHHHHRHHESPETNDDGDKADTIQSLENSISPQQLKQLKAVFAKADNNNSGIITKVELRAACQREFANGYFDDIDQNHDNAISWKEFLEYYIKRTAK